MRYAFLVKLIIIWLVLKVKKKKGSIFLGHFSRASKRGLTSIVTAEFRRLAVAYLAGGMRPCALATNLKGSVHLSGNLPYFFIKGGGLLEGGGLIGGVGLFNFSSQSKKKSENLKHIHICVNGYCDKKTTVYRRNDEYN